MKITRILLLLLPLTFMISEARIPTPLSNPILGDATEITMSCHDIKLSIDFFKKLGYNVVKDGTFPNVWCQISDGSVLILLNQDNQNYFGLNYFSGDMDRKVIELEKQGIKFASKTNKNEEFSEGIFLTPDNFTIKVIHIDHSGMYQPKGITMLSMPQEDFMKPDKYPNSNCGVFGEFSQPVANLDSSLVFWKTIGFKVLSLNKVPYPWAIITDGMNILGLHQTNQFASPAITYFSPDAKNRKKKLEEAGITGIKDFDGLGNYVLTTPDGQKIFIFSL